MMFHTALLGIRAIPLQRVMLALPGRFGFIARVTDTSALPLSSYAPFAQ
jgi:hypothetical protein